MPTERHQPAGERDRLVLRPAAVGELGDPLERGRAPRPVARGRRATRTAAPPSRPPPCAPCGHPACAQLSFDDTPQRCVDTEANISKRKVLMGSRDMSAGSRTPAGLAALVWVAARAAAGVLVGWLRPIWPSPAVRRAPSTPRWPAGAALVARGLRRLVLAGDRPDGARGRRLAHPARAGLPARPCGGWCWPRAASPGRRRRRAGAGR